MSYQISLNQVESLMYFWTHLWSHGTIKNKFNILDTIVYEKGKPLYWLFTSSKNGEILKKKNTKMETVEDIINTIKDKSRSSKSHKSFELKDKIALVWYMQTDSEVMSYLVDENELRSILFGTLEEVLLIQSYIGGFPEKGNGIFELKITRAMNGELKSIVNEYLNSTSKDSVTPFTDKSIKLAVTSPLLQIIRKLGVRLSEFIEITSGALIEEIRLQICFDSSFSPFVVALRKIQLSNVSQDYYHYLHHHVYFNGFIPAIPSLDKTSNIFPSSPFLKTHNLKRDNSFTDSYQNNTNNSSDGKEGGNNSASYLDPSIEMAKLMKHHRSVPDFHRMNSSSKIRVFQTYVLPIDANKRRSDKHAPSRDLSHFLVNRRPISAPHSLEKRDSQSRLDLTFPEKDMLSNKELSITRTKPFVKDLPLGQHTNHCFGCFCHLKTKCKEMLHQQDSQEIEEEKESNDSTFKIALKSILLTNAENEFLGKTLDLFIEHLFSQYKLQSLNINKLFRFILRQRTFDLAAQLQRFIRDNVLNVQASEHENRKPPDTLANMYRRLIYDQAITKVHPSRFYYTVSVCETCYCAYNILEEFRESVFNNPDPVQTITNKANDTMKQTQQTSLLPSFLLTPSHETQRLTKYPSDNINTMFAWRKLSFSEVNQSKKSIPETKPSDNNEPAFKYSIRLKPALDSHQRPKSANATTRRSASQPTLSHNDNNNLTNNDFLANETDVMIVNNEDGSFKLNINLKSTPEKKPIPQIKPMSAPPALRPSLPQNISEEDLLHWLQSNTSNLSAVKSSSSLLTPELQIYSHTSLPFSNDAEYLPIISDETPTKPSARLLSAAEPSAEKATSSSKQRPLSAGSKQSKSFVTRMRMLELQGIPEQTSQTSLESEKPFQDIQPPPLDLGDRSSSLQELELSPDNHHTPFFTPYVSSRRTPDEVSQIVPSDSNHSLPLLEDFALDKTDTKDFSFLLSPLSTTMIGRGSVTDSFYDLSKD